MKFVKQVKYYLKGNQKFFEELNQCQMALNNKYQNQMKLAAVREKIREAWQKQDYLTISSLNTSNVMGFTESELKKIEMAKSKVVNPPKKGVGGSGV